MTADQLPEGHAPTLVLPAGTLLHYQGMPLELHVDTEVRMNEANRQIADAFAAGAGRVKDSSTASPGTPMRQHIVQAIERGAAFSSTLSGASQISDATIARADVALAAVAGLSYIEAKAALHIAAEALGTAAGVLVPSPGADPALVAEVVLAAVRKAG